MLIQIDRQRPVFIGDDLGMSGEIQEEGAKSAWHIDNTRRVPLAWLRHFGSDCFLNIPLVGQTWVRFERNPYRPGPVFDIWGGSELDKRWREGGSFEFVFGPIRVGADAPTVPAGHSPTPDNMIWRPVVWSACIAPFLVLAGVLGAIWWLVYHSLIMPPVDRLLWRPLKAALKVALRPALNPQHRATAP